MFNNNFLNFCKLVMLGSGGGQKTTPLKAKNLRNVEKYLAPYTSGVPQPFIFGHYAYEGYVSSSVLAGSISGWAIGSDNTPATVNDYTLNGYIAPARNYTISYSNVFINDNGKYIKRNIIAITNISQEAISIGEVGYFDALALGNTYDTTNINNESVLLYREAFETPIVLQPTESVSIIVDLYAEV